MENSRISPRVVRISSTIGTESIFAGTAFDDLAGQRGDTRLRHILGAFSTQDHGGRIDATNEVWSARRRVVIGGVVQRFPRDPQRGIRVHPPRIQLLYRGFGEYR